MFKFSNYYSYLLLCMLFFFSNSLFGQKEFEFLGVLKIKDTSFISYRLNLSLSSNTVSGYSVTNIDGPHETKSYVKGVYFPEKNRLEFQEYGIEYTKSDVDDYDFCFVNFKGTVQNIERQNIIKGKFSGKYSDGVSCIDGDLIVKSVQKILKKAKRTDKKIKKSKIIPDSVKQKVSLVKTVEKQRINILKSEESTSIFVKSSTVRFQIWDSGKIDGDRVVVEYNGKILLKDYTIVDKKKVIVLPVTKKINNLKISALNNGEITPNTAKIELLDGSTKIEMLSNLEKGKSTTLLIHNTSLN